MGKNKGKNVLITGGTGFVGDLLIKSYLERTDCMLWVLSRARNSFSAGDRILSAVDRKYHDRIRVLEGDLGYCIDSKGNDTSAYLGLDNPDYKSNYESFLEMVEVVDEVFHNGSYLSLSSNKYERQKCMDINLMGTQRLLNLIGIFKKDLKALYYTSTAFVHGVITEPEEFYEDDAFPTKWLNPYEESKWKAELLIRNSGYPFRIFRPAVILKEPGSWKTTTHTIYGISSLLEVGYRALKHKNRSKPIRVLAEGKSDSCHSFMLRDNLVDMIFDIMESNHSMNHVYNTINPEYTTIRDVLYAILHNLNPAVTFEYIPSIKKDYKLNPIEKIIKNKISPLFEGYLFKKSPKYRMDNVIAALGKEYLTNRITRIDRQTLIEIIREYFKIKNEQN
jgi:nucleoside-diphosphate-sugar epimerase